MAKPYAVQNTTQQKYTTTDVMAEKIKPKDLYFYTLIGIIFVILCISVWFILRDAWEAQNIVIPTTTTVPTERYVDIESYVRSNISNLSPTKESLGGTFYVTHIQTADGRGVVSYEDGHNAYTADFTYKVSDVGEPFVQTFILQNSKQ